ncbi:unnamed protein product [marine sediment metagenome]|uniref:Transposase n=1 Tax=marine sediment metagenome TaxID=412755 RepID=X1CFB8_9ZZZZ
MNELQKLYKSKSNAYTKVLNTLRNYILDDRSIDPKSKWLYRYRKYGMLS